MQIEKLVLKIEEIIKANIYLLCQDKNGNQEGSPIKKINLLSTKERLKQKINGGIKKKSTLSNQLCEWD